MDWTEGWHFCSADTLLGYDDDRPIVVGETLTVTAPANLCHWGLHASREVWAALDYAPDQPRLCRVRLGGEIDYGLYGLGDAAATERTCLTMLSERETAVLLRRWGVWCVRQVKHLLTDPRSRRAIDVAEAWCDGTATDDDLAAAGAAALDAVGDARDATWAVRMAAWAARDAAREAGETATAAREAARCSAWADNRNAGRVRDVQRQQLKARCLEVVGAAPAREGGR